MKRIFFFLTALMTCLCASAQGTQPEFSTEESPVWHLVQFKTGSAYLTDKGLNANLQTAAKSSSNAQQWQLIGTADNFKMKNKAGRYVNYSGGKYTASSTGVDLKIVQSAHGGSEDCWEIQRVGQSQSMNQWGGAGAGKELGEWNAGDANNPVQFVSMSISMPEFSDDTTEKWYFIQAKKGGTVLADKGVGQPILLSPSDPIDEQLWKLVGDETNFQLVNKAGRYAIVSNKALGADEPNNGGPCSNPIRSSETEYKGGYSLVESTSSYAPAWMIKPNSHSGGYFNGWGGVSEGYTIGLWTDKSDDNNAFTFVDPEKMTYKDYKSVGIEDFIPENKLTLWYTQPATTARLFPGDRGYSNWMEYSLPIGNGQFGASIFGGIQKDEIQFNEKTLWSGRASDVGGEYGDYENFGSVFAENLDDGFGYASTEAAQDYYRLLDLSNAIAKVSFKNNDKSITYNREYIASNPDGVVVAHYTASEAGKLNLRFTMQSGKPGIVATTSYAEGEGNFKGKLQTVSYNARFKVVPTGGEMTTGEDGITVRGADEILVILAGATDFDAYSTSYISGTAKLASKVQALINDAAAKSWTELNNAHVADHKSFFDRCQFELAGTKNEMPTNELIDSYNNGNGANALMLEQLYFAYGRYLEIGSSRGVDLPSNLQGIWNNMSEPAWNSDIHSNINVQMNYWPAEPTNLSEMHVPFLNYIINMADSPQWKAYAKKAGQNEGWTCYTENNIFGGCGSFMHNYVISNAWYCTHLWQHYRYTLDKEYLKKAFPAMWTCSRFWVLRLKEAADGTYECPNEYSPEHGPGAENGVAHAQQLVWDLFANTVAAAEILGDEAGVDADQLATLKDRLEKLDKGLATETYDGSWGNAIPSGSKLLREWKYSTFKSGENGHRHMSHLMCIYPFNQVTPSSPYFQAAVNSMKLRGDGATGWSMGWKINLWARVHDGDHARQILRNALAHSGGGAGVYYNLYDAHSPFQIDGNFGACAGVAEMLMQSHTDTIQILPALPSAWKEGEIKGLKAVGDFTVDIAWKNGKATRAIITSNQGQPLVVNCKNIVGKNIYVNNNKVEVESEGTNIVSIPAAAKDVVVRDLDGSYDPVGIESVSAATANFKVDGRTISVSNAQQVKVIDLAGRTIQSSTKSTLSVNEAAGKVVVLQVTDNNGNISAHKVVLK